MPNYSAASQVVLSLVLPVPHIPDESICCTTQVDMASLHFELLKARKHAFLSLFLVLSPEASDRHWLWRRYSSSSKLRL